MEGGNGIAYLKVNGEIWREGLKQAVDKRKFMNAVFDAKMTINRIEVFGTILAYLKRLEINGGIIEKYVGN
jgi:hypothetical protein